MRKTTYRQIPMRSGANWTRPGGERAIMADREDGKAVGGGMGTKAKAGDDAGRLLYGVFSPDTSDTVPRSVTAGAFIGGAWAAVGLLVACVVVGCAGDGTLGVRWVASVIIAFVACAVLQQVAFDCRRTEGLPYARAVAAFGVSFYVVLALCALLGQWLPSGSAGTWVLFTVIYAMVLVLIACALKIGADDGDDDD